LLIAAHDDARIGPTDKSFTTELGLDLMTVEHRYLSGSILRMLVTPTIRMIHFGSYRMIQNGSRGKWRDYP
jgi:hypothetical protein